METKISNLLASMPLLPRLHCRVNLRKRYTEIDLAEAYTWLLHQRAAYNVLATVRSQMPEDMWKRCELMDLENDAMIKWSTLGKSFKQQWASRPYYLGGKNETSTQTDQPDSEDTN